MPGRVHKAQGHSPLGFDLLNSALVVCRVTINSQLSLGAARTVLCWRASTHWQCAALYTAMQKLGLPTPALPHTSELSPIRSNPCTAGRWVQGEAENLSDRASKRAAQRPRAHATRGALARHFAWHAKLATIHATMATQPHASPHLGLLSVPPRHTNGAPAAQVTRHVLWVGAARRLAPQHTSALWPWAQPRA